MLNIKPAQSTLVLRTESDAIQELASYTALADDGVKQIITITVPSTASASEADYFTVSNMAGKKWSCWLDIDDAGADPGNAPSGAAYTASDYKVETNIVTGGTAAQNAALIKTALEAETHWAGITITDMGLGVLKFTQTKIGVPTAYARHNTGDTGNGSFSAATTVTAGHASALTNKYIVLPGGAHYCWMNHSDDVSSADPTPGGTAIAAVITASMAATSVAAACVAGIDASSAFESRDSGNGLFQVTKSASGTATDATAGNSGFSVSTALQGAVQYFAPSMDLASANPEPDLIV